jgi:hypothetical protein
MLGVRSLTDGQLHALQLLANRLEAEDLTWINLADARALESLNLATHRGRGWVITEAGRQALKSLS